jgi:coenzyme F420-reducing hydrogenase delta subunit
MAEKGLVYLFVCKVDIRKKLINQINSKFPSIKVVDSICAGKINPSLLLKLINNGAKGVIVLGCEPADCYYREGNLFSERRFYLTKKTLEGFGFDPNRLQILWHKVTSIKPVINDIEKFLSMLGDKNLARGVKND